MRIRSCMGVVDGGVTAAGLDDSVLKAAGGGGRPLAWNQFPKSRREYPETQIELSEIPAEDLRETERPPR